jgi:DNA-binding GntR family transcriptional regulator
MSRGPVREAIRTLEGRKLVTRTAFKRARVVALDKTQIREIFEFRQSLEVTACRLATRAMTDQQLKELVAKSVAPTSVAQRSSRRPFYFHQSIIEGCGNGQIQAALGPDFYVLIGLYSRASQRAEASDAGRSEGHWSPPSNPAARPSAAADQEHWQIARAMLARDEDLVESLMRAHIARAMDAVLANLA